MSRFLAVVACLVWSGAAPAQVERVWLTHQTHDPAKLTVNWTTKAAGDSVVRFGTTAAYGEEVRLPGSRTRHRVEIPLTKTDATYHYAVSSGDQTAAATFKAYPSDVLRVAVVANWHARPDLKALLKDDPHLLLTAGDNVPDLWHACGAGVKDCPKAYEARVDAYPGLFRSVPFLPALGNHDREIRPRGPKPPADPVYDIDATAFRSFFPLPGDGWKWHFDVPPFGVRFVALDLNHVADRGTTWQTCHDFGPDSEQFKWYRSVTADHPPPLVVTLYNERNATVRGLEKGAWRDALKRSDVVVSGFGHFAERAEADGRTFLNTSLAGRGDTYPDPGSKILKSEDNYLLLRIDRKAGTFAAELKGLDGTVLDRCEIKPAGGTSK